MIVSSSRELVLAQTVLFVTFWFCNAAAVYGNEQLEEVMVDILSY